jgi:hypothetical protein
MAQEEKRRRRRRKSVDPHIVNALGQYSGFQFLTARNWCALWKMDAAYWFLVHHLAMAKTRYSEGGASFASSSL